VSELDLGLDIPEPKVAPRPKKRALSWTRYKVTAKTIHCDRCLEAVHEAWPERNCAPNLAVFKRTDKDGSVTFWCWEHGTDQHSKDGFEKPTRKKASR
jgi:hypothetical protein